MKTFGSNDEVTDEAKDNFQELEQSYLLEGIQKIEKCWT